MSEKTTHSFEEALAASVKYFDGDELAGNTFVTKYALRDNQDNLLESTPEDMHWRMANEFARIEKQKFKDPMSAKEIFDLFDRFKYIVPQGSPMYGIGNNYKTISLSNCYLLENPVDSYASIMRTDEQLVQISKRRGGVGIDLSNLRPAGSPTHNAAKTSTGIATWMDRYSNSIREVGQCIKFNQQVLTEDGLRRICDVVVGDKVWTINGFVEVVNVLANGKKALYKVTTEHGYEVVTSKDHIYQTFSENGGLTETRLENLSAGDGIVLLCGEYIGGEYAKLNNIDYQRIGRNRSNRLTIHKKPQIINEDLAYLLGYSFGDGCVVRNKENTPERLDLACSDDYPVIKENLIQIIKQETGGYEPCVRKGDGALEVITINSIDFINHLDGNGILKQKSENLIFPEKILKSPRSVQCSFLSGYFDADGYASGKKKGYCFASVCLPWLKNIQTMLLSLGIVSRIHKEERSKLGWRDLYSLTITGKYAKDNTKNILKKSYKIQNCENIPKQDCALTPFKAKTFAIKYNDYSYVPDNSQFLSTACLQKLRSETDLITTGTPVQTKIISIERVDEDYTYDLELANTHLFWCEGIIVHNSNRRGALMLTLDVHHPDIITFSTIKNDDKKVTGANISVRLSKEFLDAVEKDEEYELRFPVDYKEKNIKPLISTMVKAKDIWETIIHSAWLRAEPGLLMWNNVQKYSPADCYETYKSRGTNPCSEINLSELDSCRLLCLNLYSYVKKPFTKNAEFDFKLFYLHACDAQRLMDDMVDLESEKIDKILEKIKTDPEPEHIKAREIELWKKIKKFNDEGRRTGTGITALGDTFAALGIKYGSKESIQTTEEIYKTLKHACYEMSIEMAEELGPFKEWDHEKEKDHPFILLLQSERQDLYSRMKKSGRRNVALTTTAPTGTVSILTQTTSGIEPLFMMGYTRRKKINQDDKLKVDFVDHMGDKWQEFTVYHPKVQDWIKITGETDVSKSPWAGCCAEEIDWINRVEMHAAASKHVCHSISATVNLPEDIKEETVAKIYQTAAKLGIKGITVYRKNCRSGVLIDLKPDKKNTDTASKVNKTIAPKRPDDLPCDVFHTKVEGKEYFVIVGTLNGDPYEVFAGHNGKISKEIKNGTITKKKRGIYSVKFDNGEEMETATKHCNNNEEVITRLLSISLRHGADIQFVVHQLEKTAGNLYSFDKAIARCLKKYIPDETKVTGEKCQNCGSESLQRQEGCVVCKNCSYSKCS